MNENYTQPNVELLTMLLEHWPLSTGLTELITKFSDTECIAMHKAITSYANFVSDMNNNEDNKPLTAEVL